MYHYTYLLQHKTQDKRYIGCRSCRCLPVEDISYWGSSKHLPSNISEEHVKIILKQFPTRKEAIAHEIYLHDINDVGSNPSYYNKAKQTSTGFDTSGLKLVFTGEHIQNMKKASQNRETRPSGWKHSDEAKKRIAESKKGVPRDDKTKQVLSKKMKDLYAEGYVNPKTGTKHSEETRKRISESRKNSPLGRGVNAKGFSPWFIVYPDGRREEFYTITKLEKSIRDGFKPHTYSDLSKLLRGERAAKQGKLKGHIVGNISVNDIV